MIMEHDNTRWINERFADLGLTLTFGDHVDEDDVFRSSPIASRVADLHAAFADPDIGGILTVIGGFQRASTITTDVLEEIISRQPALVGKPVLAGVDFGHTNPLITFPVGGRATIQVDQADSSVLVSDE